jgi:hypothetical protein
MCSLRLENNLLTIAGVRFVSISKKTPLSKPSFAFVSLALPLLVIPMHHNLVNKQIIQHNLLTFHTVLRYRTFKDLMLI